MPPGTVTYPEAGKAGNVNVIDKAAAGVADAVDALMVRCEDDELTAEEAIRLAKVVEARCLYLASQMVLVQEGLRDAAREDAV